MKNFDAIIIGAGLSGLSCAVRLVEEGWRTLVIEKREVLGGRTSSWEEKGMYLESGLHRFLGFFTHLPDLLERCNIDLDEVVTWEDEIEIRMPEGETSAIFGVAPLFKPGRTVKEFIGNNDFISIEDKIKLTSFFVKGFGLFKTDPQKLDTMTVKNYAKREGINDNVVRRILVPLTEGLFFMSPQKYSAYNFFALFAPYLHLLYKSRAGAFNGGMSEIIIKPIIRFIEKEGGFVKTGEEVTDILIENGKVIGVKTKKRIYKAQTVILAASLFEAQQIIKKQFTKVDFFEPMLSLDSMPSVTFQIELKEPSMEFDRVTFSPGTVFASYAEQSRTTFKKSKGRISIILSQPQKYIKPRPEKILTEILDDAKRLELNIYPKNITSYRKVVWEKDFYSYERRSDTLRPPQQTPIQGLYLAGDYTRQKYLSTMEGAVYSGKLAAERILSE